MLFWIMVILIIVIPIIVAKLFDTVELFLPTFIVCFWSGVPTVIFLKNCVEQNKTIVSTPIQPITIGFNPPAAWPIYIRNGYFEVWRADYQVSQLAIVRTTIRIALQDEVPHIETTNYEGYNWWLVPWAVTSTVDERVLVVPENYSIRLYPITE